MNKRRQALRAQNQKIAKSKLPKVQPGNGEFLASMKNNLESNKQLIGNAMNANYGLKNPFVRPNPLNRPLPTSSIPNITPNIDPIAVAASPKPAVKPAKPVKNPTVGLNFSNTPNAGMHGGLTFNTNKGGKGINIATDTNFSGPGNILENSQVTLRGNRIPVAATIKGDGSVNVGLEGNLNDLVSNLFGGGRNKNKGKREKKRN